MRLGDAVLSDLRINLRHGGVVVQDLAAETDTHRWASRLFTPREHRGLILSALQAVRKASSEQRGIQRWPASSVAEFRLA